MSLTRLRDRVAGRVLLPGDDGFEAATAAWNTAVRQTAAAAVVEAADAADVAAVVGYAAETGRVVTGQAGGHGASGNAAGAILLRTGRLAQVQADLDQRTVHVGAGATWQQVQAAAAPAGLTGLVGSAPGVSVTGYTLGGGLGWFARRHGLAAHSVRSIDVVDADGKALTVTAESDPELFWALRGGSGNFAVVTGMELRLFRAAPLYGGRMVWPAARAREVFDTFAAVTASAPDALSTWITRAQPPGAPAMVMVDVTYLGASEQGQRLLSQFDAIADRMVDTRAPIGPADVGDITKDPTDPSPIVTRCELLAGLDEVVEALVTEALDPLMLIQLRHLGGALVDPGPTAGAAGPVTEPYLLYQLGLGFDPDGRAAVRNKIEAVVDGLGEYVAGGKPYSMLSPGERIADAYGPATVSRLAAIKRDRDPHDVFRANYPIG